MIPLPYDKSRPEVIEAAFVIHTNGQVSNLQRRVIRMSVRTDG